MCQALLGFYHLTGIYDFKFTIYYQGSNCLDTLAVPNLFTIFCPHLRILQLTLPLFVSAPAKLLLHALDGTISSGTNTYTWQIFDVSIRINCLGRLLGHYLYPILPLYLIKRGTYTIRLIEEEYKRVYRHYYKTQSNKRLGRLILIIR